MVAKIFYGTITGHKRAVGLACIEARGFEREINWWRHGRFDVYFKLDRQDTRVGIMSFSVGEIDPTHVEIFLHLKPNDESDYREELRMKLTRGSIEEGGIQRWMRNLVLANQETLLTEANIPTEQGALNV